MRVLIIGLGSIAKKHIAALGEVLDSYKLFALRSSDKPDIYPGVTNVKDVDGEYDFAIISSPSSNHLGDIKKLSGRGIPLMVEKPFLISVEQMDEFRLITPTPKIYVACNLRFTEELVQFRDKLSKDKGKINEVTSYCGSYLPDWRAADYRESYSAKPELGGGVHLDLVHEFDLLYYILGKPTNVIKRNRKYSTLELGTFDYSNYIIDYLDFEATVKLNYFRRDYKRYIEIVTETETHYLEFNKQELFKSYVSQMDYFIENVVKGDSWMNNPEEALEVLEMVI